MVPPDLLVGSFLGSLIPVHLHVAQPPPQDRSLSDVWSALGGELKPSLDLVVTAPFTVARSQHAGPPVREVLPITSGPSTTGEARSAGHAADPGRRGRGGRTGGDAVRSAGEVAASSEPAGAAGRPAPAGEPGQSETAAHGAVSGREVRGLEVMQEETVRSVRGATGGRVVRIKGVRRS